MSILQVVTFLIAFVAQFSRVFTATRPFWAKLPSWFQVLAPPLVPALAALSEGLTGVKSWTDLVVVFIGCAALILPGMPSNRSAAPMQASKPVTGTPSVGDATVAAKMQKSGTIPPAPPASPSIFPGPLAMLLLLCCFGIRATACTSALPVAKAVDQAAVLLCADYYSSRKPGLSLDDIERAFCSAASDIAPFLAEAKSGERRAGARLDAIKASEFSGAAGAEQ